MRCRACGGSAWANPRPWPGLGTLADCAGCGNSQLLPAVELVHGCTVVWAGATEEDAAAWRQRLARVNPRFAAELVARRV